MKERVGPRVEFDELEGLAEVAERVVGSENRESRLPRLPRVFHCLVVDGLGGAEPVVGELGDARCRVFTANLLDALGDTAVKPGPARGSDLLVQAVLNQGMAEAVAPCDIGQLSDEGRSRS